MRPTIGVVLGSGLGSFADELTERTETPYADIPGWPHSTAIGHAGKLVTGRLGTLDVAVWPGARICTKDTGAAGRLRVRELRRAAYDPGRHQRRGRHQPELQRGDLVLISDHINLLGVNPLIGPNDDALVRAFPT